MVMGDLVNQAPIIEQIEAKRGKDAANIARDLMTMLATAPAMGHEKLSDGQLRLLEKDMFTFVNRIIDRSELAYHDDDKLQSTFYRPPANLANELLSMNPIVIPSQIGRLSTTDTDSDREVSLTTGCYKRVSVKKLVRKYGSYEQAYAYARRQRDETMRILNTTVTILNEQFWPWDWKIEKPFTKLKQLAQTLVEAENYLLYFSNLLEVVQSLYAHIPKYANNPIETMGKLEKYHAWKSRYGFVLISSRNELIRIANAVNYRMIELVSDQSAKAQSKLLELDNVILDQGDKISAKDETIRERERAIKILTDHLDRVNAKGLPGGVPTRSLITPLKTIIPDQEFLDEVSNLEWDDEDLKVGEDAVQLDLRTSAKTPASNETIFKTPRQSFNDTVILSPATTESPSFLRSLMHSNEPRDDRRASFGPTATGSYLPRLGARDYSHFNIQAPPADSIARNTRLATRQSTQILETDPPAADQSFEAISAQHPGILKTLSNLANRPPGRENQPKGTPPNDYLRHALMAQQAS